VSGRLLRRRPSPHFISNCRHPAGRNESLLYSLLLYLVSFVDDNPLKQPPGTKGDLPAEPCGPVAMAPVDDPFASLRQATLKSERIRIIGLIFVFFFILVVFAVRAVFGGLPEQLRLLPQLTALILASVAYESLMLGMVGRAIKKGTDFPIWAWSANAGIEALIPTIALILLTESPFMGPYRAQSAPATHSYYIFIILSTLRLRPSLCFLTGLASALCFGAVVVYTLVVHPDRPNSGGGGFPLQVYAMVGIYLLTCGTIAAWLSSQFRRHVTAALGEAAIRGQYERLVREISQRERAEQALRASESRYRQLTEETHDAIVVADQQGKITLFNPAAQAIFGYSETDVRAQPLTTLMPAEFRDAHRAGFQRFLDTREARLVGRTVELRGLRKSGDTFPLELSLSAIDLPEGVGFLGAIRDMTERVRLQGRVVQAEKLASIGLLSAGVAHEINNPLAYVSNNLAVLERDLRGLALVLAAYEEGRPILETANPELAERIASLTLENDLPYIQATLGPILESTRQGVKRVSRIVQNLREFARLDQAAIDRLDLNAAISRCLELIRGRLERHHIDVVQNLGEIPPIVCAPGQINHVILNLLLNAQQAIVETGRERGRIEIGTQANRREVILEITDDGCGIPQEIHSRIFDAFFTTKPVGEGTGLGLSISHSIVSDHGGRIELESTPGQGSRFRVILPVEKKRADQS
jgi:PAS domain S-box-containing protein